jgi:hypothetical protein
MSKNSKTCKYVFTQESRKGQKCGKGCRDGFCNNHKPNKLEYGKTYYKQKSDSSKDQRVLKIEKTENIDELPRLDRIEMSITKKLNEMRLIHSRLEGIWIYLNPNDEEKIREKHNTRIFGECICIIKFRGLNNECRYCNRQDYKQAIKPFICTAEAKARTLEKSLIVKYNKLIAEIKDKRLLCNAINKRRDQLMKKNQLKELPEDDEFEFIPSDDEEDDREVIEV